MAEESAPFKRGSKTRFIIPPAGMIDLVAEHRIGGDKLNPLTRLKNERKL